MDEHQGLRYFILVENILVLSTCTVFKCGVDEVNNNQHGRVLYSYSS